jgi:hypothetical protein
MSEASTEPAQEQPSAAQPDEQENDQTDWKAAARKWEQRSKEHQKAARDLEQQRQASMTEAERAIAEAEQRGRTAAATEFGTRLVRASFAAEAARRNPAFVAEAVMDDLNLARFVGDDGEPDIEAITAAVTRLVPEPATNPRPVGDADLGVRGTPPIALNGDGIEQALKRKLGIG